MIPILVRRLPGRIPRAGLVVLALSQFPTACRFAAKPETPPPPLCKRISWRGNLPAVYSDSSAPDSVSASDGLPIRFHFFEFIGRRDTVRLRVEEFTTAPQAYAAFERTATAEEMAQGCYTQGNTVVFRHGKLLGRLFPVHPGFAPEGFLKENLAIQGEELFSKPVEFSTFPLLGRFPESERVIPRDFLGRAWHGPVFTVDYRCHGDTATAFRAFPQNADAVRGWFSDWNGILDTLDWGRELRFRGWDEFRRPLILWSIPQGLMGISGCFDPVLAQEYAEKMKKTAVFWPDP